MKKYELVNYNQETKLWQIKALKDIPRFLVKKGDLGGWIAKEENLSQENDCWVSKDALVFGNALVYKDARVYGNAQVFGNARVYGNAWVSEDARVSGDARVYEDARVSGDALVFGNAQVFGNALVYGNAQVFGNARVSGDARVSGNAQVFGNARVYGNAQVYKDARVSGDALVFGNAQITKCLFIQQPKHNITTTDTYVFIGCEGYTWETWEKDIQAIGIKHGYTQEEINIVGTLLTCLAIQIGVEFNYKENS